MIFDSHFHIGKQVRIGTLGSNFQGGCLVSKAPSQNDTCFRVAQALGVSCAIFANSTDSNDLRSLERGEVLAYKHVELLDNFDRVRERPLLEAARTAGMTVIVHLNHHTNKAVSTRIVSQYLDFVTDQFPGLRILIAHLGGEAYPLVLGYLRENEHMSFDISCLREVSCRLHMGSSASALKRAATEAGAKRLLFGSDMVGMGDRRFSDEFVAVRSTLPEEARESVLWGNSAAFFGRLDQNSN